MPGYQLTQARTRSINARVCPMRVQTARFARSIPVIARVLEQCSTVQETALLVVGARRSRAIPNIRDMHETRSVAKLRHTETTVIYYYVVIYCYRMLR